MTTVAEVFQTIRNRLEPTGFTAAELRFKGDGALLPDEPAPFVFVELVVDDFGFIAIGGGRGNNLQRTQAQCQAHILAPVGTSVPDALVWGEQIAALFRSQRLNGASFDAAECLPTDGKTDDGNYDHVATTVIDVHFDKTG